MTLQEYLTGEKELFGQYEEVMCLPQLPCARQTPYGEVEGLKCVLGSEVNTNTTWDAFPQIIADGVLKPSARQWVLGQDSISLSACPPQTYGGTIKFIFDSEKLLSQLRAMCYVDFGWKQNKETGKMEPGPNEAVERGMGKEAHELIPGTETIKGDNRIRAKYGIMLDMYRSECEYVSYDSIPLKGNLKRIEFWIAARLKSSHEAAFDCSAGLGPYANIHGDYVKPYLMDRVKEAKRAAEWYGVDFKVRSCFPLMKTGYGTYVELNEENLDKIGDGELPEGEYIESKKVYEKDRFKCFC